MLWMMMMTVIGNVIRGNLMVAAFFIGLIMINFSLAGPVGDRYGYFSECATATAITTVKGDATPAR